METETTNEIVVPNHYNPNQIVTYRVIDADITNLTNWYPTVKVSDLEYELHNYRRNEQRAVLRSNQINELEQKLSEWIDEDTDASEIVAQICEIFGFVAEKEIHFEATATITGTVSVPLGELADFDIDSIDLNVYADSHTHTVEVDIEIDNISRID